MLCRFCRETIADRARICKHCDSRQDWVRHINFSNTTLSLLVALLSVMTVAAPVLFRAWHGKFSDVFVKSFHWTENGVSLVLENRGTVPGYVRSCKFAVPLAAGGVQEINTNLDPRSSTRLVPAQDLKEVFFRFDKNFFRDVVLGQAGDSSQSLRDGTLKLTLNVEIEQYGGEKTPYTWTSPAKDLYYNVEFEGLQDAAPRPRQ